jgi:hypothetical protein
MEVITAEQWVAGSEYLPAARINKPIRAFCEQFKTVAAPLRSGTPGIRFRSQGNQFILREVPGDSETELLVPMIDPTKTPRSINQVENSFVAAMKDLRLILPDVTSLHRDLNPEHLEYRMGFGLRAGPAMDLRPIQP